MPSKEDWFWACRKNAPAGDAFIIADGQDELWSRAHTEIDRDERCAWNAIHRGHDKARLEDILNLLLVTVPMYQISHNKFMFEAAKMPVFAKFLRYSGNCDLCNYVSNSVFRDAVKPEAYSNENMRKLGRIVNDTLNIDDDWF